MNDVKKPDYTSLAEIYDTVMEDVDYEVWADFIDEIIQVHHPKPETVLELACGTGSLAFALNRYGCYDIMGTDKSQAMVEKARAKATEKKTDIEFKQMDFLNIELDKTFDIIVSIFDSVNYLHTPADIKKLLEQTKKLMARNSLFIFDFTTPKNSRQAIKYLDNEEGITSDNYKFFRKSKYDEKQQIHYNIFEIEKLADDHQKVVARYTEEHQQRTYSLTQMQQIVGETDFEIVANYSEFDLDEATPESLRITMVLRCPNMPL